ncbi:unnamed protein product, partial [Meganyctiphanes norvegica]
NTPMDHSVVRLLVSDADSADNGTPYKWELLKQDKLDELFVLNQDGIISLAKNILKLKNEKSHVLHVRVWDNGSPPLYADCKVNITILKNSYLPPTVFRLTVYANSYLVPFPPNFIGN